MGKPQDSEPHTDNHPISSSGKTLPERRRRLLGQAHTIKTEADEQRLTHVETKVAHLSTPNEFEYFTQVIEDGSYSPDLIDYVKAHSKIGYLAILTKDGVLAWGSQKKNGREVGHPFLKNALEITDRDAIAIRAWVGTFNGQLKFTMYVADASKIELLASYWAKSLDKEDAPLEIWYPGSGTSQISNITLHEYVAYKESGKPLPRHLVGSV